MGNVTAIDVEPRGRDIASLLKQLIEANKDGGMSSISIAVVCTDGTVESYWSKLPSISLMIGSVARLQAALIRMADEE